MQRGNRGHPATHMKIQCKRLRSGPSELTTTPPKRAALQNQSPRNHSRLQRGGSAEFEVEGGNKRSTLTTGTMNRRTCRRGLEHSEQEQQERGRTRATVMKRPTSRFILSRQRLQGELTLKRTAVELPECRAGVAWPSSNNHRLLPRKFDAIEVFAGSCALSQEHRAARIHA